MCLVKPYDPYFSSYGQFIVKNRHDFPNDVTRESRILQRINGGIAFKHYISSLTLNDNLGKV